MAWLSRRTTAEWHRHKPQTSTDSEHFWTQELERVMQAVGRQHPVSIHIVDIWNSYPPGVPKLPKKVFLCLGFEGNLNWEKKLFSMQGSQALNDLNCCRFGSERLLDGRTIWCIHPKWRLQPSRSFPENRSSISSGSNIDGVWALNPCRGFDPAWPTARSGWGVGRQGYIILYMVISSYILLYWFLLNLGFLPQTFLPAVWYPPENFGQSTAQSTLTSC